MPKRLAAEQLEHTIVIYHALSATGRRSTFWRLTLTNSWQRPQLVSVIDAAVPFVPLLATRLRWLNDEMPIDDVVL